MNKRTIKITCALLCALMLAAVLAGCKKTPRYDGPVDPNDAERGIPVNVTVEKLPLSSVSDSVSGASTALKEQYQNASLYPEVRPGTVEYGFTTLDKGLEFIGLDSIKKFDLGLTERASKVRVTGRENGDITSIELDTQYWGSTLRAQLSSSVYTTFYDGEYKVNADPNGTDSVITTKSGDQLHVIKASGSGEYSGMTGYIVKNDVLYSLYAAYAQGCEDEAVKLFEKWAEQL